MGGGLIADIISRGKNFFADAVYVLSAAAHDHALRRFLYENNFFIGDEIPVKENGRISIVMRAFESDKIFPQPSDFECEIGRNLIEKKTPLVREYAAGILKRELLKLKGLQKANAPDESKLERARRLICELNDFIKT